MTQRSALKKFVFAAAAVAFTLVTIWSAKTMAVTRGPLVPTCRTPPC